MPFSRSRSLLSMISVPTSWLSRKVWLCFSSASTSVVLPWSTWAMIATFRMSCRISVIGLGNIRTADAEPSPPLPPGRPLAERPRRRSGSRGRGLGDHLVSLRHPHRRGFNARDIGGHPCRLRRDAEARHLSDHPDPLSLRRLARPLLRAHGLVGE